MVIVVHALWGLAQATAIRNIPLLVVGGMGGHILLDAIPHRDLTAPWEVVVDILTGTVLFFFLRNIYSLPWLFGWSVLFSCIPDFDVLFRFCGITRRNYFFSHFPSWHGSMGSFRGVMMNILTGVLLLVLFIMGMRGRF
ncbi:MAG: hypothetical protein NTX88_12765 [Candidatus Atribacteria bacterium]|nr:hypothetical protein [Candidatus Atribacteria bacterium]